VDELLDELLEVLLDKLLEVLLDELSSDESSSLSGTHAAKDKLIIKQRPNIIILFIANPPFRA